MMAIARPALGGAAFLPGGGVKSRIAGPRRDESDASRRRVHRGGIAEVMVDIAHDDRVAAGIGEIGARRGRFDDVDLGEP